MELTVSEIRAAVKSALAEDIGGGDVTTLATIPKKLTFKTVMRAHEPLVVAGLDFARVAFLYLSSAVKMEHLVHDGTHVAGGDNLLRISGSARAILTGRTEFCAAPFRHRHSDGAICGRRQGHSRADTRHTQNDARLAAL
jgi:nicotinate-nucleotide pyrophosphorylase